jgi:hypothetical protein
MTGEVNREASRQIIVARTRFRHSSLVYRILFVDVVQQPFLERLQVPALRQGYPWLSFVRAPSVCGHGNAWSKRCVRCEYQAHQALIRIPFMVGSCWFLEYHVPRYCRSLPQNKPGACQKNGESCRRAYREGRRLRVRWRLERGAQGREAGKKGLAQEIAEAKLRTLRRTSARRSKQATDSEKLIDSAIAGNDAVARVWAEAREQEAKAVARGDTYKAHLDGQNECAE